MKEYTFYTKVSYTDFLTCSDTLGNGQKCHYKGGVTVTRHFYCKVDPIEA